MNKKLLVIDNYALGYVVVGDFHDDDEKVMFLREGLEECFPRYLRYNPHGWSDPACFLYVIKELVKMINEGTRDESLETKIMSSYLQHNSCLQRMSYLPFSPSLATADKHK